MKNLNVIEKIDWDMLRNQKLSLLCVIDSDIPQVTKDDLTGILHLLDAIQDYAVDELDIDSQIVFNFNDEFETFNEIENEN